MNEFIEIDKVLQPYPKGIYLLRIFKFLLSLLVFLIIALLLLAATFSREEVSADFNTSRQALVNSDFRDTYELVSSIDQYHFWLEKHGLLAEIVLFELISSTLFKSAQVIRFDLLDQGLFYSVLVNLHFVVSRIAFSFFATWRLWTLFALLGFLYARYKVSPYFGNDLLGGYGNGRLFDSGIHIDLSEEDTFESAGRYLRSPIGIEADSAKQLKQSSLFRLLRNYNVLNSTNSDLAAMIIKNSYIPFSATAHDGRAAGLAEMSSLTEYLEICLKAVLEQRGIAAGLSTTEDATRAIQNNQIDAEQLILLLRSAISAAQPMAPGNVIAGIRPELLTTFVISFHCSRLLTFKFGSQGWTDSGRYPELSARAILHSLPSFFSDYSYSERKWLRQALVFARPSRSFRPFGYPVNLEPEVRFLRNLAALMQYADNQMQEASEIVEYVSLAEELHNLFCKNLTAYLTQTDVQRLSGKSYLHDEAVLLPLQIFDAIVSEIPEKLHRFEELLFKLGKLSDKHKNHLFVSPLLRQYFSSSFLAPLGFLEIKEISRILHISEDRLKILMPFIVNLRIFGWIPQQVSGFAIPQCGIVKVQESLDSQTDRADHFKMIVLRKKSVDFLLPVLSKDNLQRINIHQLNKLVLQISQQKAVTISTDKNRVYNAG